jgi:putative PEP-CTERM system TPR-repeat lipoprotein
MRFFTASVLILAMLGAGCMNDSTESLISSAKESLAKNDTSAAIIQLRNAIQRNPDLAEARFLFGRVLLQAGDPTSATVELRKARALKYAEDDVLPPLARALLAQEKFKVVTDEFGATKLGNAAAMADLKNSVAAAFVARGMLPQAEDALQAALQAKPDYAAAQVSRVGILARKGDFNGAFALIATVLEQHPQDSNAWKVSADLLLSLKGDLSGAFDAYRKAIAIDKTNIEAHAGAITILFSRADEASIGKQLDELRKLAPNHPQTRYFDALLAYKRRDFVRATALLQDLLRLAPGDPRVLQLAGATELETGALVQAEDHLLKAVQLTGEQPMSRQLLAQTHLRTGQWGKAIDDLKPALDHNPDAVTLSLAAQAYLQAGDAKRAEELFGRVAKLDPADTRSRTVLDLTTIGRGNADAGFADLETVAAADKAATTDLALISAHLARREFAAALSALDALEKKAPAKAFASSLRGRVLLLSGDAQGARRSFERALSIDPVFYPAVSSLAELDLVDKKPDAARQRYEAVLRTDPKNMRALLALANLSARTGGSKDDVAKLLDNAAKANPAEPSPRLQLVEHYLRSQEPRQALNAAQNGVAAIPNSAEMLDALGRAQLAAGAANQAVGSFNALAAMLPNSAEPLLRLAGAQLATKNVDAARQSLKRALDIAPKSVAAHQQLVALELASGRQQEALGLARTLQKQQPKEAIGFVLEGDVQGALKNPAAAVTAYRTALKIAPTPETAVRLHLALLSPGKSAEANRFAAEWLKEHPRDILFLLHLGNIALDQRDFAQAELRYQEILRLNPNNVLALSKVAWAMTQQKKRGAVTYAEKAYQLRPDQPAITATLALVLAEEGQFDRAIELQKEMVKQQPQMHLFQLNLARMYIKAGKKTQAEAELNELAKLGDEGVSQAEVAGLLRSLKGG